jgi:hypothetical protein
MTEQMTLDGSGVPIEKAQRVEKGNPLIPIYGPGPEGATCRTCIHLYALGGVAGHYLKCDLRKLTHGPGSDHRAKWPACGRYEGGRQA